MWGGAAAAPDASCTPTCDNVDPGTRIPDPTNCQRYYICLQGGHVSDFTEECDDGEVFNEGECENEENLECFVCAPPCKFTCPQDASESMDTIEATLVADRNDCNIYYVCIPGNDPQELSCPDDKPFFNGEVCSANENECCDLCSSFCYERFTEIPDPTNCTNFYYCDKKGYPDETSLYHCSVGNFDELVGSCVENASCHEPCTPTPPSEITTTPTSGAAVCDETFKCEKVGYFPKCLNRCDPHYYECMLNDLGEYVEAQSCNNREVIHPDRVLCVPPEYCPYPPNTYHGFQDLSSYD